MMFANTRACVRVSRVRARERNLAYDFPRTSVAPTRGVHERGLPWRQETPFLFFMMLLISRG